MKRLISIAAGIGVSSLASATSRAWPAQRCDSTNGGITLPAGFCATVFADYVGVARHMVVAPNGDVFVALNDAFRESTSKIGRLYPDSGRPGMVVLRDANGDGKADRSMRTAANTSTGIALRGSWLYLATRRDVLRYRLDPRGLGITGSPDTIATDFPEGGHNSKSLALDDAGNLFVSVGSYSTACRRNRNETAPDPCPELPVRSGIWRYSAERLGQRHPQDGERWATGIRNATGLTWDPATRALYAASHGRDDLARLWPRHFSVAKNAETPSEEFMRVERGDDFGWPYCYHDRELGAKVLAPEYGGDGRAVGRCASAKQPLVGLPAHWGPNALAFYSGNMFPPRYRGGAFIAFHGSWNRMPLPEQGYNVVFVPFRDGRPIGTFEVFADGFAGDSLEPVVAIYRPTGLAVAPDGALFISDDQRGRIWRVTYGGTNRLQGGRE